METLRLRRRSVAGKLRDNCIFYRRARDATDEFGNQTPTAFEEHYRTRGDFYERPARQELQEGVMTTRDTAVLRIRTNTTAIMIDTDDRVEIRGRLYVVRGVAQMTDTPRLIEMRVERII